MKYHLHFEKEVKNITYSLRVIGKICFKLLCYDGSQITSVLNDFQMFILKLTNKICLFGFYVLGLFS